MKKNPKTVQNLNVQVNKGLILKKIRQAVGLSLIDLGKIAKVSFSYISRLENGSRRYNEDLLISLSLALGCSPLDLLGMEKNQFLPYNLKKDLPVYSVVFENEKLFINFDSIVESILRPIDLYSARNAFGFYLQKNHKNYMAGDFLIVNEENEIVQNSQCVIILHNFELIIDYVLDVNKTTIFLKNNQIEREKVAHVFSIVSVVLNMNNIMGYKKIKL